MHIALLSWGLFFIFMAIHLVAWRIHHPVRPILGLVLVYGFVMAAWLVSAQMLVGTLVGTLQVVLYYSALVFAYMQTYPAIGGDSPTISLMAFLAARRNDGVPREEMDHFLAARPFVQARLKTLLDSKLVQESDGRYIISGQGSVLFRIIFTYRKLYGPISRGG